LLALSPLLLVLTAIVLPNLLYEGEDDDSSIRFRNRVLLLIVGIVLSPLTVSCALLGMVVPGSCLLVNYIYQTYKESRERREERKAILERIREREKQEEGYEPPDPDSIVIVTN